MHHRMRVSLRKKSKREMRIEAAVVRGQKVELLVATEVFGCCQDHHGEEETKTETTTMIMISMKERRKW